MNVERSDRLNLVWYTFRIRHLKVKKKSNNQSFDFFTLVLKTVLQRRQHCLDGASLAVKVGVPAADQTDQEDMEESRTIELNGLAPTTTEDSIRNFFENTRRSGGGDIDSVEFNSEEGFAVITFMSAESEFVDYRNYALLKISLV